MKKILLRAKMAPLGNYSPAEVICCNLIGNNMGNMLFQSSVNRALLLEDTQIDTIHTKKHYTPEDISKINATYSCLILPFANAFRRSFIDELDNTAELINHLKIPCVVVGIGAQAPPDKKANDPKLDESVKNFMKAVLNKSAVAGVRGEFTADYLASLGFQAEKDYTVIGCPSMYMYGEKLPEMEIKELTPKSLVSINSKISLPEKFHNFMWKSCQALPNHVYIAQVIEEIRMMFTGTPLPKTFWNKKVPEHFPADFNAPIYASGSGLAFTNTISWIRFLQGRDFSFGSRIHGNIAAILAGTPCFVIVSDQRISELVDYHHIPHLPMKELTEQSNIFDLYDRSDFSALQKGHPERFKHYLDFLHTNGLDTIFDKEASQKNPPYDLRAKKLKFAPFVQAFSALTPRQQSKRKKDVGRWNGKKNKPTGKYGRQNTGGIKEFSGTLQKQEPEKNSNSLICQYILERTGLNKKKSTI